MPLVPVLFPLHPIVNGKCACSTEKCPLAGKHPAVRWKDISQGDDVPSAFHGAGYGLKTGAAPNGSGVFVIDIDSEDALIAWGELDQGRAKETYAVATGRGLQLYFEHPGFRVKNSCSKLAQKIDIRGDGGMVVAAGSPHKSGVTYEVLVDAPVAPAPDWLLEWLKVETEKTPSAPQRYEGDVEGEDLEYHCDVFTDFLASAPPAVAGQGGDEQLWRVIQRGAFDLALPVRTVFECIRDVYNPRCSPPWGEAALWERVSHKARDAKTISTRTQIPPLPRELADAGAPQPWDVEKPQPLEDGPPLAPEDAELVELEASLKVTWGEWDRVVAIPKLLVQDLVPEETVGMIVAKGSSLKTWMALSIGISVANGQPWLGKFEVIQTNVLIVDFESGEWQLLHRAQILSNHKSPGLGLANFPHGRIDDEGFWRKLSRICRARKVGLVIVDSFAAGAVGVEENDRRAADPLLFASRFSDLCKCSVVFIHHAKKGEGGDERDLVRGTGAIYAALDWAVTLIPNDDNRTRMTVRNIKPWGPRPEDFKIALLPGTGGLVLDTEASEQGPEDVEKKIEGALRKGPIASKELLARAIKTKTAESNTWLEKLLVTRKVIKLPGSGYQLDDTEARRDRILRAVRGGLYSTLAAVAKAAYVGEDEVEAIRRAGAIARDEGEEVFKAYE